jgi:hypothetical protein
MKLVYNSPGWSFLHKREQIIQLLLLTIYFSTTLLVLLWRHLAID